MHEREYTQPRQHDVNASRNLPDKHGSINVHEGLPRCHPHHQDNLHWWRTAIWWCGTRCEKPTVTSGKSRLHLVQHRQSAFFSHWDRSLYQLTSSFVVKLKLILDVKIVSDVSPFQLHSGKCGAKQDTPADQLWKRCGDLSTMCRSCDPALDETKACVICFTRQ